MSGALSAFFAKFVELQFIFFLFAAHLVVVLVFAFGANQRDRNSFTCHLKYPWVMG